MNIRFGQGFKQKIKQELAIWRVGAMPGILVISLVILARVTGNLQFLELAAFDRFLSMRPSEPTDEKILIVGIDEKDIQQIGTHPIPDRDLAALIEKIESYQPTAIGLDIFRDLPVPQGDRQGYSQLVRVLQKNRNLIGIDKANGHQVKPPPFLTRDRVGFVDAISDRQDKSIRRSLLSFSLKEGEIKKSLTLALAEIYLKSKGHSLKNLTEDEPILKFGDVEVPLFESNFGGYIGEDSGGDQVILNYRNSSFVTKSFQDIIYENDAQVLQDLIRDRIVFIGIRASSVGDTHYVPSIGHTIYGVELQAHAVSQLINAVLEQRPLIKTWSDGWEYAWIIFWGFIGISLGRFLRAPMLIFLSLATTGIILIGICYGALLLGWWIPVVPCLLVLSINAAGLTASLFYRYRQELKYFKWRSQDRQKIIERIFNAIHAQPLQTLNDILRRVRSSQSSLPKEEPIVLTQLEHLERELRQLRDFISREMISSENIIYINEIAIDLENQLKDILYQTYDAVMRRDLPCFATLKVKIPNFSDIDDRRLSIEQKGDLCRFLEEALINVGKYAEGVTRLKISCGQQQGQNFIRVEDNGVGVSLVDRPHNRQTVGGWGSKAAKNLAWQLRGKFKRYPNSLKGTVCELTWTVNRSWFWFF